MKIKGAIYALIAFALFASHDLVIKILGASFSPFQLVFFSTLFSFPLITFMLMQDKTEGNLAPHHPWWSIARTIGTTFQTLSAFYAFSVLPLTEVYALIFAMPLLITILSIPVLKERVGLHRWIAVGVGLIGVLIVLRPGTATFTLGHAAALACAFFGAFASVVVRRIGHNERTVVLMLHPLVANFVGLISLFGFAAGVFLILAYKASEAVIVAPMQYSQIIWASAFGYLFFSEVIDGATILGAALIIGSGLYVLYREAQGPSQNTPVTRNRSRSVSASSLKISPLLRRPKK